MEMMHTLLMTPSGASLVKLAWWISYGTASSVSLGEDVVVRWLFFRTMPFDDHQPEWWSDRGV